MAVPALHPNIDRRGARDGHAQNEVGKRVPDLGQARANLPSSLSFKQLAFYSRKATKKLAGIADELQVLGRRDRI